MSEPPSGEDLPTAWAELELLYQTAPVGLCLVDAEYRYVRINQLLAAINGVPREAHVGRTIRDILPELADQLEALHRTVIDKRQPALDIEVTGSTRADPGSIKHWRVSFLPVTRDDSEILGISAVVHDITDLRTAQRELAEERDLARRYLDIAAVAIVGLDLDGRVNLINEAGCALLGLAREDILGSDWIARFIPPAMRDEVKSTFKNVIEGRHPGGERHQNPVVTASGEVRVLSWQNTILTGPDGRITGTLSSGTDITEQLREAKLRRRLKERVQMMDKLQVIGGMAGGMAHDFNSLLTIVSSNLDLLKGVLSRRGASLDHARAQAAIEGIEHAAETGRQLVERVLNWGRSSRRRGQPAYPNQVIEASRDILQSTIGDQIELVVNLEAGVPAIAVDDGQLKQILLHIVRNASEALPRGGTIWLSARIGPPPDDSGDHVLGDQSTQFVELRVKDDGDGIPPELLEDVLQPFVSTKYGNRGAGLGLSIVQNIVEQAAGKVIVESPPGDGCTVRCFFPFHTSNNAG